MLSQSLRSSPLIVLGSVATLALATNTAWGQCLANETIKLTASDGQEGDWFAYSVAARGNLVIVGAMLNNDLGQNSGAAYIYRFDGKTWIEEATLFASDGESYDYFGGSVAIGDQLVIVSATGHDDGGSRTGAVYVYRHDGKQWNEETKLLAFDRLPDDFLGASVAISGNDVVIAGAPGRDDNGSFSGAAYIFRFDRSKWNIGTKITASDGDEGDRFGDAVSIDGNTVIVGAPRDEDNGTNAGSAYIYRFDGQTWEEETKLLASDGGSQDQFGRAVGMSGDFAIVGAFLHDHEDLNASGGAYVYRYDGESWDHEKELVAADAQASDQFGLAVAVTGAFALVGAYFENDGFGAAYLYQLDPDKQTWSQQAKLEASDREIGDRFGDAVALTDELAVVGSFADDSTTGAAYIFTGLSDCNSNNTLDVCDIADGQSFDVNNNGIPDECECIWDLDKNGIVGVSDLLSLLAQWGTDPGGPPDFDGNDDVGVSDLLVMLANWGPCP